MRTLNHSEKRTIRIGGIGIAIYLVLFGGFQVWKRFEIRRSDYLNLVREAQSLRQELLPYQTRIQTVQKLMDTFHMDPAKLSRASVVAETSAAIQKAATTGGIQLGPIRESNARGSTKELATMQFEGTGPVPAVMGLLSRMESLGYPLIIDAVQLTPETMKQGQVKVNLTIVILDFDQWKEEAKPHA